MTYAVLADLVTLFGERELVELTDDAGVGSIDEGRVAGALTNASSIIESYIAARHQLPLATVPEFLRDIACDLARFRLWRSTPPDGVKDARAAALRVLADIATGKARLDQGVETQPARPGAIIVTDPGRIFSRQSLEGF